MAVRGVPTGVGAGMMVREALEELHGLHPTPAITCACGATMRVTAYVLTRPLEAECPSCHRGWYDEVERAPLCLVCGWGNTDPDHGCREGHGSPEPSA